MPVQAGMMADYDQIDTHMQKINRDKFGYSKSLDTGVLSVWYSPSKLRSNAIYLLVAFLQMCV